MQASSGINHVALEVGDVDEAVDFYGRMFEFAIRERSDEHALIWRVTKCWRC